MKMKINFSDKVPTYWIRLFNSCIWYGWIVILLAVLLIYKAIVEDIEALIALWIPVFLLLLMLRRTLEESRFYTRCIDFDGTMITVDYFDRNQHKIIRTNLEKIRIYFHPIGRKGYFAYRLQFEEKTSKEVFLFQNIESDFPPEKLIQVFFQYKFRIQEPLSLEEKIMFQKAKIDISNFPEYSG